MAYLNGKEVPFGVNAVIVDGIVVDVTTNDDRQVQSIEIDGKTYNGFVDPSARADIDKLKNDGLSSVLVVTYDKNNGTATHTAGQIYEHVQNGGTVVFYNGVYYSLSISSETGATFYSFDEEDSVLYTYVVDTGGDVEKFEEIIASTDYVDNKVKGAVFIEGNEDGEAESITFDGICYDGFVDYTAREQIADNIEMMNNFNTDIARALNETNDLNTAVFDVQEVGVCPNLFDPKKATLQKVWSTIDGEAYFSVKIPCAYGDKVYVRQRGEHDTATMYTRFWGRIYETNGASHFAKGLSGSYLDINKENASYFEVGFPATEVTEEELADFIVTINYEPTEFVEYWEGTTKTVNRIEKNAEEIELLGEKVENVATKNWQGKKVLVMGDSISQDSYANYTKWVTVLKNQDYFPYDTNNNSKHGTGFVATADGGDTFLSRIETVADKDTYDLVVIFGGINDAISSKPMGEKGGDKTAEFKPAVDYFFDYLVNNFTQARIVVLSPLLTKATGINTAGHRYIEYINYIKEVAKSYCLPILNLTEESGFCPFITAFSTRWTYNNNGEWAAGDGVHPNAEYEEKHLAPMIKNFLNQFI